MANAANVLPDIDEPKMRTLGKQLNRSRKASIIYHDKMKDQLDIYSKSMEKAKRSLAGKYQVNSIKLKKNLAFTRGTQKILRRRREQTFWEDSEEYPYGIYEGEKLSSYRHEVENIIQHRHPKERRLRKVEQYMRTGKVTGRILDEEDARSQFETLMSKDYNKEKISSSLIRREHPLGMTFLKDKALHTSSPRMVASPRIVASPRMVPSPRMVASPMDNKSSRGLYSAESESVFDGHLTPKSSPSKLTLPPITAGKNFVKYSKKQPTKFSLPNLQIRRATKANILPEGVKNNYSERFSKRRATTFV